MHFEVCTIGVSDDGHNLFNQNDVIILVNIIIKRIKHTKDCHKNIIIS